jgi:hypothetical protein
VKRFRRQGTSRDKYVARLREHNRQRDKSLQEKLREELVTVDPNQAYHPLISHRQKSSLLDVETIAIEGQKRRSLLGGSCCAFRSEPKHCRCDCTANPSGNPPGGYAKTLRIPPVALAVAGAKAGCRVIRHGCRTLRLVRCWATRPQRFRMVRVQLETASRGCRRLAAIASGSKVRALV